MNSAGWDGASPLHWAARGTVTAMVELLVERGADLSATDPKDRLTPLGWAERAKQQEMMELLKKLGHSRTAAMEEFWMQERNAQGDRTARGESLEVVRRPSTTGV